jgi:hypothetical protein
MAEFERFSAQIERRAEALENASIESGNQALKALLLLNGGACIAILGFLSSTYTAPDLDTDRARLLEELIRSLGSFAWGAGSAVLASTVAYLTNSYYARALMSSKRSQWRIAWAFNLVAVLAGTASLAWFACGVWTIQSVLR